ncbi:molybdenum cofactor guanylyltransferase [Gordonia sp. ABSL1-1]|uniref:molybdenum cofactor guanylyltransferase n=1 Tax=Gordonia sp. ABSL1-1 TaxID=3053923 RepID=UPI002572F162|nr:molybdenum cofactor guanylyltransferase [Gordonia sp. ABSL1-1]MDL9938418.1 molybdenum cofactor guanylyltransferase [Gordonia sp. ABSL1-1]
MGDNTQFGEGRDADEQAGPGLQAADGRLAGIVLAGGRSRRMGQDKAAMNWQGEPMLARVVRTIGQRCDPVLVVAPESSSAYQGLFGTGGPEARWITDETPGTGPLGGLAAGLAAAAESGAEWAFVCATDMPLIEVGLVDELLRGVTTSAEAVIAQDNLRVHPMAGVYRTSAAGAIADLVAADERRMLAALDVLNTHWVTVSEGAWLTNVNAPEDLHRLRV